MDVVECWVFLTEVSLMCIAKFILVKALWTWWLCSKICVDFRRRPRAIHSSTWDWMADRMSYSFHGKDTSSWALVQGGQCQSAGSRLIATLGSPMWSEYRSWHHVQVLPGRRASLLVTRVIANRQVGCITVVLVYSSLGFRKLERYIVAHIHGTLLRL